MGGLGILIVIGALSPFAAFGVLWLAGKIPRKQSSSRATRGVREGERDEEMLGRR